MRSRKACRHFDYRFGAEGGRRLRGASDANRRAASDHPARLWLTNDNAAYRYSGISRGRKEPSQADADDIVAASELATIQDSRERYNADVKADNTRLTYDKK
jgi:hypothetical protein